MSASRHPVRLAALALLAAVLAGCGTAPLSLDPVGPEDPGGSAVVSERPAGVPPDAEQALVDRVVDGDTVRLRPLPGSTLGQDASVRVRLQNIDAPELPRDGQPGECLAQEATERLTALLADDELVWIAADREDRDRFDRPLRALWTDDGVLAPEVLAREGLAVAVLFPPNDRFHERILDAEQRAAAAQLGVHGPACR
jgi:micrococcal nuclease